MLDIEKMIENILKEKLLSMSLRDIIAELSEPPTVKLDKDFNFTPILGEWPEEAKAKECKTKKTTLKDHKDEIKKYLEEGLKVKEIAKLLPDTVSLGKNYNTLRHFIRKSLKISITKNNKINQDKKMVEEIVKQRLEPRLNPEQTSLALLDVSDNMRDRLKNAGVTMISDLIKLHPSDLLKIRGIGDWLVNDIQQQLMDYGLTLNYGKYLNGATQG